MQMQMVDIRPSLTGSTREEESLELVDRCLRGDEPASPGGRAPAALPGRSA